jgi:filamentous hemagglutinin family protein
MTRKQVRWHHPFRSLVIGVFTLSPLPAIAQRIPVADDTLGTERSQVTPFNPSIDLIDGGARRGANLFHSFREFNIDVGRGVYFTNLAGVANILTRVTGGNPSQLLGTLGVLGTANLFLINPNGILFGPNAQLDFRGGSFVASTANSILFNNGFTFSATVPQAPPLLTVHVPIGLQYGSNPSAIQVQRASLQVPNGQTLTLVGGTVNVDGGRLFAPGGRVELAGVGDAGEVGLTQQGREWRLSVPEGLARADVAIGNDAIVNVSSSGGGGIAIIARNLTITESGTLLLAGIAAGFGTIGAQAGDIDINATEAININSSRIRNVVLAGGTGDAGDIRIATNSLSLANVAQVSATTFGKGNAGNIIITASDAVSFDGSRSNGSSSGAFSAVETGATGQGGDIRITTRALSITNGAILSVPTFGRGNAGNVMITASDAVSFDGVGSNRSPSSASSAVASGATGQGGNISITTGMLSLTNGAAFRTTTFGSGDAGKITITARDAVSFDGVGSTGFPSGAFSQVGTGVVGQGGDISITTGSLSFTNGGEVTTSTRGNGNAGNITITARDAVSFDGVGSTGFPSGAFGTVSLGGFGQGGDINVTAGSLSLTNGGYINTSTFGQGEAGNITITAKDRISFDGESSDGITSSASSAVASGAIGQGGDIRITTGAFSLTNGASVDVSTSGRGTAGSITITAREAVSFDRVGGSPTGAFSSVSRGAIGRGGDISINTGALSLISGGAVVASTFGQGDAGNITITAKDRVSFNGVSSTGSPSGAGSTVESGAVGQGGSITVNTELFSITDGGTLSASSLGQGDAGNLEVNARQLRLDNQGAIAAQTASGQGGNITLQVLDLLLLRRGSSISTTAGTAQAGGDGGNITFTGKFIVAVPNENSDITANAFTGSGGRVEITTQGIFGIQFRPQLTPLSDITASSEFGVAGVVAINTPDVDPSRGLVQLPVDLTDASRLIVQTCPTGDAAANQFIITGRGGLPPSPSEATQRDAIQVDLVTVDAGDQPSASQRQSVQTHSSLPADAPIVEANGWQIAADGTVIMVAAESSNAMVQLGDRLIRCQSTPSTSP